MSFAYNAGVITQTGTDTDPLGLDGLTGITIIGVGIQKLIIFEATQLVIDGTLTLPKYYSFYFSNTPTIEVTVNGVLNVDFFTTTSEGTVYHTSPWMQTGRASTSTAGEPSLQIENGGVINWRGGSILSEPVVLLNSGSTALFNSSTIESDDQNMFRIFTTDMTFEGPLTVIGKRTTLNKFGITLDNYSPKGGGGIDHGKTGSGVVLNNFNPEANSRDSVLRFDNADSIYNAVQGMLTKVSSLTGGINSSNGGGCRLYRKVKSKITDSNGSDLENVKTYLPNYDNGGRVDLTANFGAGWDFTTVSDTTLITAVNGESSIHDQILKVWYLITTDGADTEIIRFDKNADDGAIFTASSILYEYSISSSDYELNGLTDLDINPVLLLDASITELVKASVDAYVSIDNSEQFYDRAKSYLYDNYLGESATIVSRSGDLIDAGAFDVDIDATAGSAFGVVGNKITIKASLFTGSITTTGTIALLNGASSIGTLTDTSGAVTTLQYSVTGMVDNSRIQLYNATTASEILNAVNGTTLNGTYIEGGDFTNGDTVRLRATNTRGLVGYKEYEATAIAGDTGFSFLVNQTLDAVYNSLGIDGSTITNFTADYINDEVDISVASDFTLSDFYAWWEYTEYSEEGIRSFFGGLTGVDEANFNIHNAVVDIKLDNATATNVSQLDNKRLYRDDLTRPVIAVTTGGGGIDVEWRSPVLIANSDLISESLSDINDVTSNTMRVDSVTNITTGTVLNISKSI